MASEEGSNARAKPSTVPTSETGQEENEPKEYTNLFFQRQLGFKWAATFMFIHGMGYGMVQGYYGAVQFNLNSLGATFNQLSTYSLANYPYTFKFMLAPLFDRYYLHMVGRSKTYVIAGGALIGVMFMFLGPTIQTMIENLQVGALTAIFVVAITLVQVVIIAGDTWIMTLFSKETKAKGVAFQSAGQTLGVLFTYNIFTPLNDTEWLNQNLFPNNPRTSPILTHSMVCFIIAVFFLAQITVNLLFIAEEKINDKKAKNICNILKIVPRHFTNSYIRKLILYMFATRFIYFMVDSSFDFKLVRNGYFNMTRSVIPNIDTIMTPLAIVTSLFMIYYLRKGILMKMYHLTMIYIVLNGFARYLIYLNLVENKDYTLAVIARFFTSFVTSLDFSTIYMFSFVSSFVNKAIGNTGISCLMAIMNQTVFLSRTLGFAMLDWFSYDLVVLSCLSVQLIILLATYRYVDWFDKRDSRYFDITEAEVKEGTYPTNVKSQ